MEDIYLFAFFNLMKHSTHFNWLYYHHTYVFSCKGHDGNERHDEFIS